MVLALYGAEAAVRGGACCASTARGAPAAGPVRPTAGPLSARLPRLSREHHLSAAAADRTGAPPGGAAPRRRGLELRATTTDAVASPELMQELVSFLQADLPHLFDEQGIDRSKYQQQMRFEDPITRYTSVDGYIFNIAFLKKVFSPTFELHWVRVTGPNEITFRWTMTMILNGSPFKSLWDPQLLWTGVSIMGVNPATGQFCSHTDRWDSIRDQQYLSREGVLDLIGQVSQLYKTPDLESPKYSVLKRTAGYEVRRYEAYSVAEAPLDGAGAYPEQRGGGAFRALAGYIFGGNAAGKKMDMTTPVYTEGGAGTMQFVLGGELARDVAAAPAPPAGGGVRVRREPGGLFAAVKFPGVATSSLVADAEGRLRAALAQDGLTVSGPARLARYNDPSTPGPRRRNEVLLPVSGFDLSAV